MECEREFVSGKLDVARSEGSAMFGQCLFSTIRIENLYRRHMVLGTSPLTAKFRACVAPVLRADDSSNVIFERIG